ncbi:polysaccharide pyruvyl transferase family protein [Mucilaginibacter calamicampi]|uniref:Polysaccharide pyruvyl transferase family protein n=1 Tax=Mucilaginibacter calamicampi TaxID=1302352 RepID=A0ABW2YWF0_9SPHI
MKIGILTFHSAHNYGAVLQAYGTQEYLKTLGHEVEIIDYRPHYIVDHYKLINLKRIFQSKNFVKIAKKAVWEALMFRKHYLRYTRFNDFINNRLYLSGKVSNEIPPDLDAYIFGSDQIWNPKITNGFDKVFFGEFPAKQGSRKIAYAASMEAIQLTNEQKTFFTNAIKNFDYVGVRELVLQQLLQPLTSKPITTVIDPTLLLKSTQWEKIAVKPDLNQKYVLVYQVRVSEATLKIACDIAKQIGGVVVELVAHVDKVNAINKYQSASVEEFLGWIKYSDCVVTTSFHGTIFSMIFNKPFYTMNLHDGWDSRSASLLRRFALSERLISVNTSPNFQEIDYSEPNKKMDEVRQEAYNFLHDALK